MLNSRLEPYRFAEMTLAEFKKLFEGKKEPFTKWRDDKGNTVLALAAQFGRIELVKYMFEAISKLEPEARKAWLNCKNINGSSALDLALFEFGFSKKQQSEHSKVAKKLFEEGIQCLAAVKKAFQDRVTEITEPELEKSSGVYTVSHYAASLGNLELLKRVIGKSSDELPPTSGFVPRPFASLIVKYSYIKPLLGDETSESLISPATCCLNEESLLAFQVIRRNRDCIKYLANKYPWMLKSSGFFKETILHKAVGLSDVDFIRFLLGLKGCKEIVKEIDYNDENILHYAIKNKDLELVKYLANTHPVLLTPKPPSRGVLKLRSIFLFAIKESSEEIIKFLFSTEKLKEIGWKNALTQSGEPPANALYLAIERKVIGGVVKLLLNKYPHLDIPDHHKKEQRIATKAVRVGDLETVRFILEEYYPKCMKHQSRLDSEIELISENEFFTQIKADIYEIVTLPENRNGLIYVAIKNNNLEVIEYLIQKYRIHDLEEKKRIQLILYSATTSSVKTMELLLKLLLKSSMKNIGLRHDMLRLIIQYAIKEHSKSFYSAYSNMWGILKYFLTNHKEQIFADRILLYNAFIWLIEKSLLSYAPLVLEDSEIFENLLQGLTKTQDVTLFLLYRLSPERTLCILEEVVKRNKPKLFFKLFDTCQELINREEEQKTKICWTELLLKRLHCVFDNHSESEIIAPLTCHSWILALSGEQKTYFEHHLDAVPKEILAGLYAKEITKLFSEEKTLELNTELIKKNYSKLDELPEDVKVNAYTNIFSKLLGDHHMFNPHAKAKILKVKFEDAVKPINTILKLISESFGKLRKKQQRSLIKKLLDCDAYSLNCDALLKITNHINDEFSRKQILDYVKKHINARLSSESEYGGSISPEHYIVALFLSYQLNYYNEFEKLDNIEDLFFLAKQMDRGFWREDAFVLLMYSFSGTDEAVESIEKKLSKVKAHVSKGASAKFKKEKKEGGTKLKESFMEVYNLYQKLAAKHMFFGLPKLSIIYFSKCINFSKSKEYGAVVAELKKTTEDSAPKIHSVSSSITVFNPAPKKRKIDDGDKNKRPKLDTQLSL